jgi:hypothetical protein
LPRRPTTRDKSVVEQGRRVSSNERDCLNTGCFKHRRTDPASDHPSPHGEQLSVCWSRPHGGYNSGSAARTLPLCLKASISTPATTEVRPNIPWLKKIAVKTAPEGSSGRRGLLKSQKHAVVP